MRRFTNLGVNRRFERFVRSAKMEKQKTRLICRTKALPIVQYGLARCYADLRANRFRDIAKPHNFIPFDSEQGRIMCKRTGVIMCPSCGMSVIASGEFDMEKLRCMRCYQLIVPLFGE